MTNITPQVGKSHLPEDQVRALREEYKALRDQATSGPDQWEDVTTTDDALAAKYGITRKSVAELVIGRTRRAAGGPIDMGRRAESDQFRSDSREYGTSEAHRRKRYRQAMSTPPASPLTVTITIPGQKDRVMTVPSGSVVSVETGLGQEVES